MRRSERQPDILFEPIEWSETAGVKEKCRLLFKNIAQGVEKSHSAHSPALHRMIFEIE